MSKDKKVYEYTAPAASIWLSRFILGKKRRMGVARRQDKVLTVDQIILIGNIAEKEWIRSNSKE